MVLGLSMAETPPLTGKNHHPDNCEENIYGEKIGGIVEGKDVNDRSCYLLNDYNSEFNIWDVSICTFEVYNGSSNNLGVVNSL